MHPWQRPSDDQRSVAMDRSINGFRNSKVVGIEPSIEKQADCRAGNQKQPDTSPPRRSGLESMKCQDRHNEDEESGEAYEVKPSEPGRSRGKGVIRELGSYAGRTAIPDELRPSEQQTGSGD
jgi:hypothetical protein